MASSQFNLAQVLASGAIGAASALIAQYLASRSAQARLLLELQHRREELWSSFVLPAANARLAAVEKIYDVLQEAIERRGMTKQQYEQTRPHLMYIPDNLRFQAIQALTRLIRADAPNDIDGSIEDLKKCQNELRKTIGLQSVEFYVSTLTNADEVSHDARRKERR